MAPRRHRKRSGDGRKRRGRYRHPGTAREAAYDPHAGAQDSRRDVREVTASTEIATALSNGVKPALSAVARDIYDHLVVNGFSGLPEIQVICLAEEVSEFIEAWHVFNVSGGLTDWDEVRAELADVEIVAYMTARTLGYNLDEILSDITGGLTLPEEFILPERATMAQVDGLAIDVGHFLKAWRRSSGNARKAGTTAETMMSLAHVVIAVHRVAAILNIDLDDAVVAKLRIIYSRGWRSE